MKHLFLNKENVIIKETAQPFLHEFSLLIAVHYAYVTAQTDLAMIETAEHFFANMPHRVKRVLDTVALRTGAAVKDESMNIMARSYACVGQVLAVGKKVTKFGPGDFVTCLDTHHLPHTDIVCVTESSAVKLANDNYLKEATLIPFAAGILAVIRRANLQIGHKVGVVGLDLIGLLTLQLAKIAGCTVLAIDAHASSLGLAAAQGALPLQVGQDDIEKEAGFITEQHGLDAVFITSNNAVLVQHALHIVHPHGTILLLGEGAQALHNTPELAHIHIMVVPDIFTDIVADDNERADNWHMRACVSFMEKKLLTVDALLEDQVSLATLPQAYERMKNKISFGALVSYEQALVPTTFGPEHLVVTPQKQRTASVKKDTLQVGFMGMSHHIHSTMVPLVARMKNVTITSFCDEDSKASTVLRKKYSQAQWCTHDEMLTAEHSNVLFIATPHAVHAEQALYALEHGKAVFLERPMVTTFAQLEQFMAYLGKNPQAPLAVGYSYSFAPFIKKIKKILQKRRTPLMAHYRFNRELKNGEQQLGNAAMNAGSIIGDTIQIVDLFCHLTDSFPIAVGVSSLHAARDDVFPTDNVTVQITFHDGSVCSFLYTTLGHPHAGTDRLELYFDGKVIVMENYEELHGFGLSSSFNETVTVADRGYEALIANFFKALEQETFIAPIPLERLQMVARLTLIIDELACEGGGKKEL